MIFFLSTDQFSASHTSRIIEPLLRWLFRGRLTAAEVERIHFFIRKLAHLTEYAVLAALTWNAISQTVRPFADGERAMAEPRVFTLALLVATLYAAGDEFHQSFVPSRTSSIYDVMIDAAGASAGLAILLAARVLTRQWARRRRSADRS